MRVDDDRAHHRLEDVRYAAISSLGTLIDRADLPPDVYADTLHAFADMFNDGAPPAYGSRVTVCAQTLCACVSSP